MTGLAYPPFAVLLVDDEPGWLRTMSLSLERSLGVTNLLTCEDPREVMGVLERHEVGLVLLDLTMPHLPGEELLRRIVEAHPDVSVIVVSGLNQLETAVRCMQAGAFDYFVKTSEEDRIVKGVGRAIRMQELQRENREIRRRFLDDALEHPEAFDRIVTADARMHAVFRYVEAVSRSRQPVLVTGESGTGKELIARAVHQVSGRAGELVPVNVAGLDDTVFADTLFGHVRGAFTGAAEARAGMVERAGEGTLFLDEIGDLSPASQVKLLRLLQEGEYYPLGSDRPRWMRARVVVATHHDLAARQAAGTFRADLYYRLRAHHVHLPPLRERRGDIPLLLEHFLAEAARELGKKKPTPPKQLAALLASYAFPGNVRELRAMAFDAVGAHQGRVLSMEAFRRAIGEAEVAHEGDRRGEAPASPFAALERIPTLDEADELLVQEALRRADGNQSLAARLLGITPSALSKRLKARREAEGQREG
ncbi:sigma-54 dependent transcriptional regulator [Anaeromyxobacter sp. PSR-1]|uniref:sigma-54-dependent transcriptional regulator n=1 Tax=unclassified Anaeromyxobacter TaxID=2620896 RepID=UPI0005E39FC1|nr:sigma-54 dependent transcriptional regulator [Anaeromyxobacter sp. PSR-1]GAO01850.1 hydrogenase transcriptional regulatory protein HoxA [Anaeromyxobacter sp. PSR-1]